MTKSNTKQPCTIGLYFFGKARPLRVEGKDWADAADKVRFAIRHCAPEYAAQIEAWLQESREHIARDGHMSGLSVEHCGKGLQWSRDPLDDWTRDFHARCADLEPFGGMDYFDDIAFTKAD